MLELLLLVAAMALFGVVLSNPKIMFVVSWATVLGLTGFFGYMSYVTPEVSFFNTLIGTLIFLFCAGVPYFIARKVMESLWPDMMISGVIGQGQNFFIARFWAAFWSFLVPVGVSFFIAFFAANTYYEEMVDGYKGVTQFSEESATPTNDKK